MPDTKIIARPWKPQDLIDDYVKGTPSERAEMERIYGKPPSY